jgi:DNA (cytosine-5)-methyltransferase 1
MAAIDLYSGIGGWTLGFRMAGIPVVASYEWWKDANLTHNKNFGSRHCETDIRKLELKTLPKRGSVKFVVGSPPCTQFSYSNRGGNGDIKDGLIDIMKFLDVVEYSQPKYWAMENVPRVAKILAEEIKSKGKLAKFKYLFGDIRVYNSSDFGIPQDRKRMIAGRLPFDLLDAYKANIPQLHLGDILNSLLYPPYTDPIYGIQVQAEDLSDHIREPRLSEEEERINKEAKTHHPVYNRMSFPDNQNRPSRTITALCTRVSRESIIIRDDRGELRRLTIRERAGIQTFPMNYQFFGGTYPNKLKMIGNAVPPLLTFYIAQSMLETPLENLLRPKDVPRERLELSRERATDHTPDNQGAKYPWGRSFWLAIRGLRFGSGVRFDLKNFHNKDTRTTTWRINFYYGSSKEIKNKELDRDILERALRSTGLDENDEFNELFSDLITFLGTLNERGLQLNWTNIDRTLMGPIGLVDTLAGYVQLFRSKLKGLDKEYTTAIATFIKKEFEKKVQKEENKKKTEKGKKKQNSELSKASINGVEIFIGMLIGASFNLIMQKEKIKIKRNKVRA